MISELLEHSDEGILSLYLADNTSRICFQFDCNNHYHNINDFMCEV